MTEKWIIENGEVKDTTTNMTFDSFVEIITVLNGQSRRITELASDNKRLKFQLNDCLNKKLFSRRELEKENEQLNQFKKQVFQIIDDSIKIYEDTTTNDEFLQIQLDTKLQTLYNLRKELLE